MKSERRTLVGGLTLAAALLTGQVDSKATAEHAQQMVAQINGVKSVDNELKTKSD